MELTLLNFSKRLNSTKQPTAGQLAAGKNFKNVSLKQITNIDNPDLVLAGAKTNDFAYNYAYIHDWGRYYHIKTCDLRHEDIYHAKLELDDLATFKSQILASQAYIVYSSTGFNRWIRDDRVPIIVHGAEISQVSAAITKNGNTVFDTSYDCIIMAANTNAGLYYYILDEQKFHDIVASLMRASGSVLDSLVQQFSDAIGSIISVRRLPVNPAVIDTYGNDIPVYLGDYECKDADDNQIRAYAVRDPIIEVASYDNIGATYTDFRYTEPYCNARIALPFVGVCDISLTDFPDYRIYWKMVLDVISGRIAYSIKNGIDDNDPVASFSGECGMLLPIASSQIANAAGVIASAAGAAIQTGIGLLGQNPAALANGIGGLASAFYASQQKTNSVVGAYAGNRSEYLNTRFRIVLEKFLTANEPSNLTNIEGRPVCKVDTLTNYTGYIKTQGFSIDIDANSDVIRSINSKLDAGIYIE